MIDLSADSSSLSEFKRKTPDFIARLRKTGNPVLLTVNGKAELVVQEAASYQRLVELAERAEMMDFLEKSRQDVAAGRTRPMREAIEALGKEK